MTALIDPTTSPLRADAVALGYDDREVVTDLRLAVEPGKITALVGPNGSGKSTILKALVRILTPRAGAVLLDGEPIGARPSREVARRIAILPQRPTAPDGLTVRELVAFGRHPYRRPLRGLAPADHQAIERAITRVELTELADRPVSALSGGQSQRVWVAMALAQETGILLLDEPTNHLDIAHQIELLALLRRLNREHALTVVMAIHDLNLAARHADRMIALRDGRIIAAGPPAEVMTTDTLEAVFGVRLAMVPVPGSAVPVFVPGIEAAPGPTALD